MLLAAWAGVLDVPYTDEWGYLREINLVFGQGPARLGGWGEPLLLGHLAWGKLVQLGGGGLIAMHLVAAAVAGAALAVMDAIARALAVQTAARRLALLMVALSAPWLTVAPAYLTDGPSTLLTLLALCFGIRGVQRASWKYLAACVAAGAAAFSVREPAVIPSVVALPVAWVVAPRLRRIAVVLGLGLVAIMVVLYAYRHGLPGQQTWKIVTDSSRDRVLAMIRFAATGALFVLPLTLASLKRGTWAVSDWMAFGAGALVVSLLFVRPIRAGEHIAVLGVEGFGSVAAPGTPQALWLLASLSAIPATGALAVLCTRVVKDIARRRSRVKPEWYILGVSLALSVAFPLMRGVTGHQLYDRYLVAVLPLAGIAMAARLHWSPGRSASSAVIAMVMIAAISVTTAIAIMTRGGTEWHVAELAARDGYPEQRIDGGVGWVGTHAQLPITATSAGPTSRWNAYYAQWFPNSVPCVRVADVNRAYRGISARTIALGPLLASARLGLIRTARDC